MNKNHHRDLPSFMCILGPNVLNILATRTSTWSLNKNKKKKKNKLIDSLFRPIRSFISLLINPEKLTKKLSD